MFFGVNKRISMAIGVGVFLVTGCTTAARNELIYQMSQPPSAHECINKAPIAQEACYKEANKRLSFDEYTKKRNKFLKKKAEPAAKI